MLLPSIVVTTFEFGRAFLVEAQSATAAATPTTPDRRKESPVASGLKNFVGSAEAEIRECCFERLSFLGSVADDEAMEMAVAAVADMEALEYLFLTFCSTDFAGVVVSEPRD